MHKLFTLSLIALVFGFAEVSRAAADGPNAAESIQSVLVRKDSVFVSCPKGLFRASTTDKKWVPLKLADRMPANGFFAQTGPSNSSLYYYAGRIPSATTKTFGLYRADASGDNWELLSSQYDFKYVFVHEDKTIYAIAKITENQGAQTIFYDRILRSTDSGKNWDDISHGTGRGVDLYGIFPDPDHKELVCLEANTVRGYVMQANDKNYDWKSTAEWVWHRNHPPADSFFADKYSTGTALFMLHATLSNYFDYPFGDREEISSFKVTVGGRRDFKQKEPIVLPIEITFLSEYDQGVELLDTDHGHACWSLLCISPDGTRQTSPVVKGVARGSPDVKLHRLAQRQTYTRSLDITAMGDFSKPGTYRVQFLYYNWKIADRSMGDWVGQFSSPVVEIKVAP